MVEEELERHLNGETSMYEVIPCMETKDGEWGYFVNAGKVVEWDENDNPKRFIGILKDVTDLKEIQRREKFLNSLLRQDLRSKYDAIQGYLQLFEGADLPEEYKEYLDEALVDLAETDEILELSRKLNKIEESEWVSDKDVVKILGKVMNDVSDLVDREGVEIEENYPEKIGKVKGTYSLNTLFSELLKARVRFAKCDEIRIKVEETDGEIQVRVEDDGKSLLGEVEDLLSGRVYTGETTGVGGVRYYMIKQIAEHDDVNIEVKDSDLGGVRFDIYLKNA